ncbi:N-alpha-acetyltransferase 40 isoform X3 [Dendrobium catenatum]|uniref:N-alpha-acetyltransferase 40 isoform X3 n=1 Tax=Dendrobium catenatum TaxID=906689 RepID=UPI0009F28F84|nr:N-alpha-acetyltransferase 40 isoform X3 [Dendrobium catenatum]
MDSKRLERSKNKKLKRKEVLERKKVIEEIIKSASTAKDHLASFLAFSRYDRNGLSVYLESGFGDQLSSSIKKYIQNLLKVNMEGPYGSDWPLEEKVKRREMVAAEARYIFVRESSNVVHDDNYLKEDDRMNCWTGDGDPLVGFMHYRFIVEEEIPVLYVYELQLESCARGKGLGKFLMQLIELIARKNQMGAVILTVQKANVLAMNFYTSRLRYVISAISPSKVDPLVMKRAMRFYAKHSITRQKTSLSNSMFPRIWLPNKCTEHSEDESILLSFTAFMTMSNCSREKLSPFSSTYFFCGGQNYCRGNNNFSACNNHASQQD